jgi:hypothetical protein
MFFLAKIKEEITYIVERTEDLFPSSNIRCNIKNNFSKSSDMFAYMLGEEVLGKLTRYSFPALYSILCS